MPLDEFGNYIAVLTCSFAPQVSPGGGSVIPGQGSPEGVVDGSTHSIYVDLTTGDIYTKNTDTGNTGWVLSSSSGSGATGVFAGNGDPTGVVVPTTPGAIYIQIDSDPPGVPWQFYSGAWH